MMNPTMQDDANNPAANRFIHVHGARQHNLKNFDVAIPREQLVLFTGLSGSGKSTLAFDTIYAEGQRRYVESLSVYARQFLEQLQKPDVEYIEGLPPTIAVEQRSGQTNPRSTVATTTEIYDYLRLLFARVGIAHCPVCGREIHRQTPVEIIDAVATYPDNTKVMILAPVVREQPGAHRDALLRIKREGFIRARIDGDVREVANLSALDEPDHRHTIEVVVDRLVIKPDLGSRLADSIELALKVGDGQIVVARQEPPRASHRRTSGANPDDNAKHGDDGDDATDGEAGNDRDGRDELDELAERIAAMRQAAAARGELEPGLSTSAEDIRFALAGKKSSASAAKPSAKPASAGATPSREVAEWLDERFSELYACPDNHVAFEPFTPRLFSFNSPLGACMRCDGLGTTLEVDAELCVPNPKAPLADAIEPWKKAGRRLASIFDQKLAAFAKHTSVSLDTSFEKISESVRNVLLYGGTLGELQQFGMSEWEGVKDNLERRFRETDSEATRQKIMEYMGEKPCPECKGARLGPIPRAVTVAGANIAEFTALTVEEALSFIDHVHLDGEAGTIAAPILQQIKSRLSFMHGVGLDYLTLDRKASTLSGGEAQRIRLATQVGSGLVGVCYVLDEPSIGLHPRDNQRLLETLKHLRDIGNTVIIVEHDGDFIVAADHVIDLGPGAGHLGGELIFQGDVSGLLASDESLTGAYLSGRTRIPRRPARRRIDRKAQLQVKGARENNLKNIDVSFPLGVFTCVTGVSGSGKSTLVTDILLKSLQKVLHRAKVQPGRRDAVLGTSLVDKVIEIDQSAIGKTPRSNPATYTKIFDEIRNIFSLTKEAKVRGYANSRFSFNVKGGRCEACQGQGLKRIEMHFLSDIFVECEACKGRRFNRETLEIRYKGRSIADVLDMTVSEAHQFFHNFPKVQRMLQTLEEVGLGYIRLGQASTTLSGGEAQRVKLAAELGRPATGHTVYILDEPSTGLHFADVARLLSVLNQLVDQGNTIIVIEHNLDIIQMADWIIDLGPEGGVGGGTLVAEGTPETIATTRFSHTGKCLAPFFSE